MKRKAGTLRTKVAAARYFHLVNGKGDFTVMGTRIKALLSGISKREIPSAKKPFNIELIEDMKNRLTEQAKETSEEMHTLFASAVVGFFFLLRVSEISQIRKADITFESTLRGERMILAIRKSKTDQAGMGVTRALIETNQKSALCKS